MNKRQKNIIDNLDNQLIKALKSQHDFKKSNRGDDYVAITLESNKKRIAEASKIGIKRN